MSIFVSGQKKRLKNGSYRIYYSLRLNRWDPERQSVQQEYLAGLGAGKALKRSKAEELCESYDEITLELLESKGITIVDD